MSCEGCVYAVRLEGNWYCDYLLTTGHRRPCPPGEDCTVRKESLSIMEKKGWTSMKEWKWDTEKARELYDKGLSDAKIAEAVGASLGAVSSWRREQGLPSLPQRRRAAPEEHAQSAPDAVPERSTVLPEGRYVELSIRAGGCAVSIQAPNPEAAAAIYRCAGELLKDMTNALDPAGAAAGRKAGGQDE